MLFKTIDLKTGATKMLPVKFYDEGRTIRCELRHPDSKDDAARWAQVFDGEGTFEARRMEPHQIIIGRESAALSLMAVSEGRDDFGLLARLFPFDLEFTLGVSKISDFCAGITTRLADQTPADTGDNAPAKYADTDAEARERAVMFSMPNAANVSVERVRGWLKLRAYAVSQGANPMGAGESATRMQAEQEKAAREAKKQPKLETAPA